jgi:WD40 repeat protein
MFVFLMLFARPIVFTSITFLRFFGATIFIDVVHDYSLLLERKSRPNSERNINGFKHEDESEASDNESSEESCDDDRASNDADDAGNELHSSLLNSVLVHERSCRAVQFSKQGDRLITAGADGILVYMDVETQSRSEGATKDTNKLQGETSRHIISKHGGHGDYAINCLQILPESASGGSGLIVTGDDEGNVKLWDIVRKFMEHALWLVFALLHLSFTMLIPFLQTSPCVPPPNSVKKALWWLIGHVIEIMFRIFSIAMKTEISC